jgi:DNA-binding MarR family transcriptional regulator
MTSQDVEMDGVSSCVYTYMKDKYEAGQTLDDIVCGIGIAPDRISNALESLEYNGYVMIARNRQPFIYRVAR